MKRTEYIEGLLTDVETAGDKKSLYLDVIDCAEIALSQTSDDFEVDGKIGLEELYKAIESKGRASKNHCVGPFEAAELIAEKLGTKYVRATRRGRFDDKTGTVKMVSLEDFF